MYFTLSEDKFLHIFFPPTVFMVQYVFERLSVKTSVTFGLSFKCRYTNSENGQI